MESVFRVLDHGFVRLVDHMGDDLSIVRAARVSYNAAWRAGEDAGSDARLIRYLIKNKHTSPLEAVQFTFEVKAPIFVLRQWHRHRTWSYNELSARYRELPDEVYYPLPSTIGAQSRDNKQGRDTQGLTLTEKLNVAEMIAHACADSFAVYRGLLSMGVSRELARGVLPLNTYSHMFASVNLHNLLHFLTLRIHKHAQYEIQQYAAALVALAHTVVPAAIHAWAETLDEETRTPVTMILLGGVNVAG